MLIRYSVYNENSETLTNNILVQKGFNMLLIVFQKSYVDEQTVNILMLYVREVSLTSLCQMIGGFSFFVEISDTI